MKFLIVIEKSKTGFSAYSPDLPGCIATGRTRPQAERAMREAIEFHLEGLRAEHMPVPKPQSYSSYVEVPA
ncbi:MAG: type II toxin-antitoxin system HicB family antitoxin [Planctomycetes bacterium]|nr:type II toxin-antitoxin system HicB family antitoxin [Planctomycetota bacterium]